ncbi:HEAT repeat domain-containing protein [Nonomuraea sp. NPDC050556]|uniref:HEAT repeat domain-containing protein n=1 Tax=Nonomuraea sp. NPDC050556 TaxID=3364369 RepID=UPI0037A57AA0
MEIDAILGQARRWPQGDIRRWEALGQLADLDDDERIRCAEELFATGDPAEMVLAGEVLDGRMGLEPIAVLLEQVCHPDQDPGVLTATLGSWSAVGAPPEAFVAFARHADAGVRKTAAQMLGGVDDYDDGVAVLRDLLATDPEPEVRLEAAEWLASQGRLDADKHLQDEVPGIRAVALKLAADPFPQLIAELAARDPSWRFVRLCTWLKIPKHARADLHDNLAQLQEDFWTDRAGPGEWPTVEERARLLNDALYATRKRFLR